MVREGTSLRLPAHAPALSPADQALWKKAEPLIAKSGLRPPSLSEIAQGIGAEVKPLEAALVRIARLGVLVRVAPNRFFPRDAVRKLGEIAAALAAEAPRGEITAAQFRDRAGVGRNVAIELLEYFDRIKLTRRTGDAHVMVRRVEDVFSA